MTERGAAIFAALFILGTNITDNVIVHNFITAGKSDSVTAASTYLVLGSWTGVAIGLILSIFLGRMVDPNFKSIAYKNGAMHRRAIASGAFGCVGTFFFLLGNQLGDPGIVVTLSSVVILYVAGWEVFTRKLKWYKIIGPLAVTFVGILLATTSADIRVAQFAPKLELSAALVGLIISVLLFSNGFNAASEVIDQSGARASDAVSFFLWRFFYFAITAAILAVAVALYRGTAALLMATVAASLSVIPVICITMLFNFFGTGTKIRLKIENAVTVVLLITSGRLVLAVPITWVVNMVRPGVFGPVPDDPAVWIERAIGGILIAFVAFYLGWRRSRSSESARGDPDTTGSDLSIGATVPGVGGRVEG